MWKFHYFSITQLLREIKLDDFKCPKTAILTHLEALNLDFNDVFHFLKSEIHENQNSELQNVIKWQFLGLLKHSMC